MKTNKFWSAVSKALAVTAVTLIMALILAPGASAANKYKVLHKFDGTDGAAAEDALVFDASGNLYGTTRGGGSFGYGTVFELTPNSGGGWTESVLYSFTGGSDGAAPCDRVIFDASGNLYGTILGGGNYGYGGVYELTPNSGGGWTESVLYSFTGGSDGAYLVGGLVFDAVGNLYGTATKGGGYGHGVVFKLTPNSDGSWTESVLHSFRGGTGGGYPDHGHLIFDAAGNLYGLTAGFLGGASNGTVFELKPNSDGTWTQSVLHAFRGGADGYVPDGTLTFDQAGSLYGTTLRGGAYGFGTVFKLTPGSGGKWKKNVIHQFGGGPDGAQPWAGVVFDTAGNLYGTTDDGGGGSCSNYGTGCGTVFKLIPKSGGGWTEHVIHRFRGAAGGSPYGEVVLDGNGNIYGMASGEGTKGSSGAVYEITP